MGQPVTDEELKLRKRARRRLVGAIALVLLAVLILPRFIDNSPPPPLKNVEIVIPPVQPVEEKFPKDLPLPQDDASVSASDPDTSGHEGPPDVAAAGDTRADEMPAVAGTTTGGEKATPAPPRPPAQAPAKTPSAAGPPPATKPADPQVAAKGYVIQLGAYGSKENAQQLLGRIRAKGFPGYTEPVRTTTGTKTRVRGGPYATVEAAEKARARMLSMKLGIGDLKVVPRGQ